MRQFTTFKQHRFNQTVNMCGVVLQFNNKGIAELSESEYEKIAHLDEAPLEIQSTVAPEAAPEVKNDSKLGDLVANDMPSTEAPAVPVSEVSTSEVQKTAKVAKEKKKDSKLIKEEQDSVSLEEMDLSALHQILADMGEFDDLPFKSWDKPTTIEFINKNL